MNTKGLARMYDVLTPAERLPLIIAASERGDAAEADRLARSAPRIDVRLTNYHGLGEGLLLLSLFHVIGQLEHALMYWHVSALAADWQHFMVDAKDKERSERMWACARMAAYRFCVEADAWKRLSGEMNIDPEALLHDLPCYDTLRPMEALARFMAWTLEEATAELRRLGRADAKVPTVEMAVRAMRDFLDTRVRWWG
jgi:hypothetical protein